MVAVVGRFEDRGMYLHEYKYIPSWPFAESIVEIKCDAIFCSIDLVLMIHQQL